MKWALNTYETVQNWPLDKIIALCKATGHEGIEFLQDRKQAHGMEASASDAYLLTAKKQMDEAGLMIASLTSCCAFHMPEEEQRRKSITQVKRVVDEAALLGCDQVRVVGDHLPDEAEAKGPVLENIGAALRELGAYAQPKGVKVSIEMHWTFTDPLYVLDVVKKADNPNVGIVFNCQWRVGVEEGWSLPPNAPSIAPLYDLVAPYITSVHTHEMERPEQWRYYQEFFRLLRRDGYDRCISDECAYTGPDPEKVLSLYTALFRTFTS